MICRDVRSLLDLFLDRRLPDSEVLAIEEHLVTCDECRVLLSNRKALRFRIREAVRNQDSPADLAHRIQSAITEAGTPRRYFSGTSLFLRKLIPVAASMLLGAGTYYWWQDRQAPPLAETQAEFIDRTEAYLPSIMRVGYSQHLHCGVFRRYPSVAPTLAELAGQRGVSPVLIDALEKNAPPGLHAVMAHKCEFRGREYLHVIARGDGHLMSLLLTAKRPGEDLPADLRAKSGSELPIYSSVSDTGQNRYSISAFEASGYLVYLVSDSSQAENLSTLDAMSVRIRAGLL